MPKDCDRVLQTGKPSGARVPPVARVGAGPAAEVKAGRGVWAIAWAKAEELGLQDFIRHQFWLALGLLLACLGSVPWVYSLCLSHPWLALWGLAALCLLVHVVSLLEHHGLVAFLPPGAARICNRPLFELLRQIVAKVVVHASACLRIGMLVCVELNEEQSREILEGLDPALRRDVFQRPLVQLLPSPLQRLLLGSRCQPPECPEPHASAAGPGEREPDEEPSQPQPEPLSAPRPRPARPAATPTPGAAATDPIAPDDETAEGLPVTARAISFIGRKSSADSLLELVRGMDDMVQTTRAKGTVAMLEGILSQKVAGSAVHVACAAMSSAKASAAETFEYGRSKVSELGEGVREVATDRKAQAAAASAVGGAVTLGAGGAASGLISGGLLGAAAGVVPAFFTFGLSIPIGAALGGGTGLCLGTTVGGAAGFLGGGVAGYSLCPREGAANEEREKELQAGAADGEERDDRSLTSESTAPGSSS